MAHAKSTLAKLPMTRTLSRTTATPAFWASYEARPGAINIATHETTRMQIGLKHHPFHLRTMRRLRELDTTKLHVLVTPPKGLSTSGFVRNSVVHRVRSLLADTMRRRGWNYDGTVREDNGKSMEDDSARASHPLSGAYFVMISDRALEQTTDQIREACQTLVDGMVKNHLNTVQENAIAKPRIQSKTRRGGKRAQRDLLDPFERPHVRSANKQPTPTQSMDLSSLGGIKYEVKAD